MSRLADLFKDGEYLGGKWYIERGEATTIKGANAIARKYRKMGHNVKIMVLRKRVLSEKRGIIDRIIKVHYGVYSRRLKK